MHARKIWWDHTGNNTDECAHMSGPKQEVHCAAHICEGKHIIPAKHPNSFVVLSLTTLNDELIPELTPELTVLA